MVSSPRSSTRAPSPSAVDTAVVVVVVVVVNGGVGAHKTVGRSPQPMTPLMYQTCHDQTTPHHHTDDATPSSAIATRSHTTNQARDTRDGGKETSTHRRTDAECVARAHDYGDVVARRT